MAVKIRLKRMGSKKRHFYRVVVADSRKPVSGGIIESIGTYNPISEPKEVKINDELALQWMKDGAKPSDTVRKLFNLFCFLLSRQFFNVGDIFRHLEASQILIIVIMDGVVTQIELSTHLSWREPI